MRIYCLVITLVITCWLIKKMWERENINGLFNQASIWHMFWHPLEANLHLHLLYFILKHKCIIECIVMIPLGRAPNKYGNKGSRGANLKIRWRCAFDPKKKMWCKNRQQVRCSCPSNSHWHWGESWKLSK